MTFTLGANGGITASPKPSYDGYQLFITDDVTQRGTTGTNLSDLFGLGDFHTMEHADEMVIASHVSKDNNLFSLAQLNLAGAVAGDAVVTRSDNSGALNLQALGTKTIDIAAAGYLGAAKSSLSEYSAIILGDMGSRSAHINSLMTDSLSLKEEVDLRKDSIQGVNLDEELSNMMIYQQSYNAAARLITAARELYDALLAAI
jgi:flagellar hook-associated protein 1 FlgK